MRAVIQRVTNASVTINNQVKASIKTGLLILLGIENSDESDDVIWLCKKIVQLRIFNDTDGIIDNFELYRLVRKKKDKSNILEYGRIDYKFYPKDTLYVYELSDYGFFKRIKETRFTTKE